MTPAVTTVICAYADERWDLLCQAVESVRSQSVPNRQVVVIDHNQSLLDRSSRTFGSLPGVLVIANDRKRGLSGARNTGIAATTSEIVAFLDDDARADELWLHRLTEPYSDPQVVGVGGYAAARCLARYPDWMPEEFAWVYGCSYRGQPAVETEVRNLMGCNMSFRRGALVEGGGFSESLGRLGELPLGCEETELCIRLRERQPGARILYVPSARVSHAVPAKRLTIHYFVARCWSEGKSKALVAQMVGASSALSAERAYTTRVLPRAVGRYLLGGRSVQAGSRLRAGAVVLGLATTTAGFLLEQLRLRFSPGSTARARLRRLPT